MKTLRTYVFATAVAILFAAPAHSQDQDCDFADPINPTQEELDCFNERLAAIENAVPPGDIGGADDSVAIGAGSSATAASSTAVGQRAYAGDPRSTAVGNYALTTGEGASAFGSYAQAHGAGNVAIGAGSAAAGSAAGGAFNVYEHYLSVADYIDDEGVRDAYINGPLDGARDGDNRVYEYVVINGAIYSIAALDNLGDDLSDNNLPDPEEVTATLATAVGADARAQGFSSTAVGHTARALGERASAFGRRAYAGGLRSTAVGEYALATGERASAFGNYAQAHGDRNVALGSNSSAGGLFIVYDHYLSVADYIADAAGRNQYIMDNPEEGNEFVVINGAIYSIADLDNINDLSAVNLPEPEDTATDATAVGYNARALWTGSIAIGAGATTTRDNQVVIGVGDSTYTLPGLATDAGVVGVVGVVTINDDGDLANDGGALQASVTDEAGAREAADIGLRRDLMAEEAARIARDVAITDLLETTDDLAVAAVSDRLDVEEGARAAADTALSTAFNAADQVLRTDFGTADTALSTAFNDADDLLRDADTALRNDFTAADTDEEGARIAADMALRTDLGTATDTEDVGGSAFARVNHLQNVVNNAAEIADNLGAAALITDIENRVSQGVLRSATDVAGGVAGGYREAPEIGSAEAPENAAGRRVVVQDTNADGTVMLSTLPLDGALSGMDARVDDLSDRLDGVAAMAAALTALPNTVGGGGRYSLGVGVGAHAGESAFAIGFSGRIGAATTINFGVAKSGSGSTTSRAGVNWNF